MAAPLGLEDGNIARRLREAADRWPDRQAVVTLPDRKGRGKWSKTFAELDAEAEAVARGLVAMGAGPGKRIVLAVRPHEHFLAIAFGLFRSRATAVLVDPGMGRKSAVRCLREANVDGVVGIPLAQLMRLLKGGSFPHSRINVCVGRQWPGLGTSYSRLLRRGRASEEPLGVTKPTDAAAVIFTSGSTGPPKGVCYEHGMFDAQWQMIRDEYGIEPGTRDAACFPLFGLFNVAMGVTTFWPRIDFARPAKATPQDIISAMHTGGGTGQSFASPAIWRTLRNHFGDHPEMRLPLDRGLSAGAPVPPETLAAIRGAMPDDGTFHTPYGATESLPACTIESREILEQTAELTRQGHGTCVGRPFAGVDVAVIRRPRRPVATMVEVETADVGEIGEVIVRSPAVTREYFQNPEATAAAKIADEGGTFWHRIGDIGYFDERGRLWFCGRISHIVETADGPIYPVMAEPLLGRGVAVVGLGDPGRQQPVAVVSYQTSDRSSKKAMASRSAVLRRVLEAAAGSDLTAAIGHASIWNGPLPVDSRHNAKVRREQIARELDRSQIVTLADVADA